MATRFVVRGRVQGVYFRDTARRMAQRLGVHGWIANCDDGSVAGVVAGDESAVASFLAWAQRGPDAARVDELTTTDDPDVEVRPIFEVTW